jgi:hypothetical protein
VHDERELRIGTMQRVMHAFELQFPNNMRETSHRPEGGRVKMKINACKEARSELI